MNYWISEEQFDQLALAFLNPPARTDEKRTDWKAREKLVAEVRTQILDQDSEP